VSRRRFGVSTHLFHEAKLSREHLAQVAAHDFEAIELFATRSHFDYKSEVAVEQLAIWLSETDLELHSVHAPIVEALHRGTWVGSFSNASGDESRRKAAVAEAEAALQIARRIPYRYLVLHLGMPVMEKIPSADNQPAAARRSVEEIVALAAPMNVTVAIEVIPNPLSTPAALVRLVEEELDGLDVGTCLDYGHARLMGDLADAIETLSGHFVTTHLHDNRGTQDEHLVPFAGTIDWNVAIMETQKVGYEGMLLFEVADTGNALEMLKRTARARERLEQLFVIDT
jgi:sugar phosphate isomerase/epimerase